MADQRIAIVTGASRGIGRACALALAAQGARVLAVARSEPELTELAREPGIDALVASLDTPERCARVVEEARSRLGPPTILVNNAGRGGLHDKPIFEQDTEGWRATMAVNLDAPFELTRQAARDMRDAGWGRIVMISSTAGQVGAPANGPYSASKQGVIGLMRSVAHDVGPYGITCNAVLPGWVRTRMAEDAAEQEASRRGVSVERIWEERAASYPAGRVLEPDEIAGVVAFLATDGARGINGEAITVALGGLW